MYTYDVPYVSFSLTLCLLPLSDTYQWADSAYRLTGGKECRGRSRREINEIITAFSPVAGDTQYEAKQLSKNQQLTATFKKPVEMGVSK